MPEEGVAADELVVGLGEGDEGVGGDPVEGVAVRVDYVPLFSRWVSSLYMSTLLLCTIHIHPLLPSHSRYLKRIKEKYLHSILHTQPPKILRIIQNPHIRHIPKTDGISRSPKIKFTRPLSRIIETACISLAVAC